MGLSNKPANDSAALALYGNAALRKIEAAHAQEPLMARAGKAAASLAMRISPDKSRPVLAYAGSGNNGGDALSAARFMQEAGYSTHVTFSCSPAKLPAEAKAAYSDYLASGGKILPALPEGDAQPWGIILDGIFGIGLNRALRPAAIERIKALNQAAAQSGAPVLALDVPSGLSAETGASFGNVVRATHTLGFIAAKPGLFTAEGPDFCGEIHIDTLGIDLSAPGMPKPDGFLNPPPFFAPRLKNTHKGSFGSVGLIGGAPGMAGALLLAGRAALRLGAGRAYLGFIDSAVPTVDFSSPELMLRMPAMLFDSGLSVLAVGPGLSQGRGAQALLERALAAPIPLVLDADALNLLSGSESLRKKAAARSHPLALTPHPMEAAKLLGRSTKEVQADRISAAKDLALRFHAAVAVKGCGTVLAAPDESAPAGVCWRINTTGNPGLATAGSGDVLTGIAAAFAAQGVAPFAALCAAAWLHGKAAEDLALHGTGPIGLTASELIDAARFRMNSMASLACGTPKI